jgi:tetratricopeptide (TPR) repeat protein
LRYLPALLGFYGWRIIYPRGLVFDYPLPTGQALVGYYLLGLLMLLVILLAWKWRRVLPGIAVGGLWFLICLLPVMGFFYVGTSFSSDRYVYLALVGPAIALARFTDTRPQGQRLVLLLVLVALTAVSGLLTHKQVAVWKNDEQLFTHAVAHQPGSVVAQTNLASYYRLKGDEALAMQHYHLVLQVLPYDNIANYNLADIHFGNGQWGMAKDAALKALKSDARYHRAHFLLGRIGSDASRPATYAPDEAFMHFEQAYQLMPGNPKYAYTYAGQLVRKKRLSEGLDVLSRGMGRLSPESPWFARYQLAISRLTR